MSVRTFYWSTVRSRQWRCCGGIPTAFLPLAISCPAITADLAIIVRSCMRVYFSTWLCMPRRAHNQRGRWFCGGSSYLSKCYSDKSHWIPLALSLRLYWLKYCIELARDLKDLVYLWSAMRSTMDKVGLLYAFGFGHDLLARSPWAWPTTKVMHNCHMKVTIK